MDFQTFLVSQDVLVCAAIFLIFSIPAAIIDGIKGKIPDLLNYGSSVVLLCYRFACTRNTFLVYLFSGAAAVVVLILVRQASGKGLGWGDIKFSAFCGIYAGPVAVFIGFLLSALFAGIYILIKKAINHNAEGKAIAFIPFLASGTFVSSIPAIVKAIMQLTATYC